VTVHGSTVTIALPATAAELRALPAPS
jgi:hypothetical protein